MNEEDQDLEFNPSMPTPWQRMRRSSAPPLGYQLSRSAQRRMYGQRAIRGIGSNGTTPSEMAARASQESGTLNTGMTPEPIWRGTFRRRPISLSPETTPDVSAFSSLLNPAPKPSYLQTPIRGAVDYMRRRQSPIMDQLRRNNFGYDPLSDPTNDEFGYA